MRSFFLIVLFIPIYWSVSAQSIERSSLNCSGSHSAVSQGSLSSSCGQIVSKTLSNNYILTQGFQQPSILSTGFYDHKINDSEILLFPNPAVSEFAISSTRIDLQKCSIQIYDLKGRIMPSSLARVSGLSKSKIQFNVESLSSAPYLVAIRDQNQVLVFRSVIIKIQ